MDEEDQSTTATNLNKPKDSKFYQQKLWAWQPILTVNNVFPYYYIVGLIFIPLGVFFLITSNKVLEVNIPYTHCKTTANVSCAEKVKDPAFFNTYSTCPCELEFTIENDMPGPVHMFYGLTNFYQNHRRFVLSRDDDQLYGKDIDEPNPNCNPYSREDVNGVSKIVAPCGTIARSLFNDTFDVTLVAGKGSKKTINTQLTMSFDNIAWKSDVNKKFGVPPASSWNKTVKPSSWPRSAPQFSPKAYQGFQALIVWMRTSALPNFRKNYGDLKQDGAFEHGLPAGAYKLNVNYAYPVTQFGGTKRFIISTSSWLGGKNPALGVGYIVVGCIHLLIALVFTGIQCHLRKRKTDTLQPIKTLFSIQFEDNSKKMKTKSQNLTALPNGDLSKLKKINNIYRPASS